MSTINKLGKTIRVTFGVCLLVSLASMSRPSQVGQEVPLSEAGNVFGSHCGSAITMLTATTLGCSSDDGYATHNKEIVATPDICTGSTYLGCGGGTCGLSTTVTLQGVGNRGLKATHPPCSTKNCGGSTVSCGSTDDTGCV